MSDYAFVHNGKAYTPNRTALAAEDAEAHNRQIEALELARWAEKPDRQLGYFHFPAEDLPLFGRPKMYRENFWPLLHTYVNKDTPEDTGIAQEATVTTWLGATLGGIVSARVYRHNFGGRMVAITMRGSNGARYHGRASWDHGTCIMLRRAK